MYTNYTENWQLNHLKKNLQTIYSVLNKRLNIISPPFSKEGQEGKIFSCWIHVFFLWMAQMDQFAIWAIGSYGKMGLHS